MQFLNRASPAAKTGEIKVWRMFMKMPLHTKIKYARDSYLYRKLKPLREEIRAVAQNESDEVPERLTLKLHSLSVRKKELMSQFLNLLAMGAFEPWNREIGKLGVKIEYDEENATFWMAKIVLSPENNSHVQEITLKAHQKMKKLETLGYETPHAGNFETSGHYFHNRFGVVGIVLQNTQFAAFSFDEGKTLWSVEIEREEVKKLKAEIESFVRSGTEEKMPEELAERLGKLSKEEGERLAFWMAKNLGTKLIGEWMVDFLVKNPKSSIKLNEKTRKYTGSVLDLEPGKENLEETRRAAVWMLDADGRIASVKALLPQPPLPKPIEGETLIHYNRSLVGDVYTLAEDALLDGKRPYWEIPASKAD